MPSRPVERASRQRAPRGSQAAGGRKLTGRAAHATLHAVSPTEAGWARHWLQVRRGGAELLLVFGSLIFLALVALLGEAAVRVYSDLNFLGNSRNLFVADAYGSSKGN